jgi:signal transduction histidine kinase
VNPQSLLNVYSEIVGIYKATGNSDKALEYQDKYIALNDSVYHLEKVQAIADTELKYEKEKDQARILAMEKETLEKDMALERRTRQRNSYLFGGTGAVLIFVFLFSYNNQRTRKNRVIAEQRIRQLEEEKKLLAARSIVEGQEEERKRIAKELHDGLGVLLSSAKMHFTSIRDQSPEARPMIDKATKLLEQASGDVRKISHNMMPGLLTKLGLYEAVEDLFEQVSEMEGINARVMIEGEQARLNENTEIMLYRIIQEMVNNALKHAEAGNIRLDMEIFPDKININFSDDGKGFILTDMEKSKSMGLKSIESRTNFMNGMVSLVSSPGKGTQYSISVPLDS